jgi:hypothetical protein
MRSSRHRLGLVHSATDAAVVRAQRRLTGAQRVPSGGRRSRPPCRSGKEAKRR